MTGFVRPERAILLEFDALLARVEQFAVEGSRLRYDTDDTYRWALQRLWIAVGNEASSYQGLGLVANEPWFELTRLRNRLAHRRLPDIDEDAVWRMTSLRCPSLRHMSRDLLR